MWGAYIQSQGTSQGAFFDTETFEPLVNNEAFAKAMEVYKATNAFGPPDELNMNGLGVSEAAQQELLKVAPEDWRKEAEGREEYFKKFGEKLPAAIKAENDKLKEKLG